MVMVLQRRVHPLIGTLIALTFLASLITAIDLRSDGELWRHLALVPALVMRGEVWRLATWFLVQLGPMSLIFACAIYFVCGDDLIWKWGTRPFARFLGIVVLAAGLGTSALALTLPGAWHHAHLGGFAIAHAVLIAWGLQFPSQCVRVFFVLQITARQLAYGVVGLNVVFAIFFGPAAMLPELIACGAAFTWQSARA